MEGTNFIVEPENLGGVESAGGEGDVLGESVGGGEGGFEMDHASFGDVFFVAGLEGEGDAFFVKLGREGEGHVFKVTVRAGHGGMYDDGDAGGFDFVEEEIGFGCAIEDEVETEFFAEAKGGGDVLMALRVDEEWGLFVENVDEGLQFEVVVGGVFFGVAFGFGDFGGV